MTMLAMVTKSTALRTALALGLLLLLDMAEPILAARSYQTSDSSVKMRAQSLQPEAAKSNYPKRDEACGGIERFLFGGSVIGFDEEIGGKSMTKKRKEYHFDVRNGGAKSCSAESCMAIRFTRDPQDMKLEIFYGLQWKVGLPTKNPFDALDETKTRVAHKSGDLVWHAFDPTDPSAVSETVDYASVDLKMVDSISYDTETSTLIISWPGENFELTEGFFYEPTLVRHALKGSGQIQVAKKLNQSIAKATKDLHQLAADAGEGAAEGAKTGMILSTGIFGSTVFGIEVATGIAAGSLATAASGGIGLAVGAAAGISRMAYTSWKVQHKRKKFEGMPASEKIFQKLICLADIYKECTVARTGLAMLVPKNKECPSLSGAEEQEE